MPELAAHLERVARDLAEAIEVQGQNRCAICFWPLSKSLNDGCVRGNCSMRGGSPADVMARDAIRERVKFNTVLVAAALAACAREEAKWWARYHGKDYNGEGTARLAALERALGEKASLDPQGGQHES